MRLSGRRIAGSACELTCAWAPTQERTKTARLSASRLQEGAQLLEHGSVLNLRLCPATQLQELQERGKFYTHMEAELGRTWHQSYGPNLTQTCKPSRCVTSFERLNTIPSDAWEGHRHCITPALTRWSCTAPKPRQCLRGMATVHANSLAPCRCAPRILRGSPFVECQRT